MIRQLLLLLGVFIPSMISANIGPQGFHHYKNKVFVETGSYKGHGIAAALKAGFPIIHSLEMNPTFFHTCQALFKKCPNVFLHLGNSSTDLWKIIADIDTPITFWLDAHNASPNPNAPSTVKNTPLLEELEQIKKHPIKTHTILIDDLHCCGTLYFDFISLQEIIKKVHEINPNYTIEFIKGGNRGEYQNNILVAYDPHQNDFTYIYDNKVWGKNEQGEGFSGGGSLSKNCAPYMDLLTSILNKYQIKSVVDAGCGDWEFSKYIDWKGIQYIGYDIVYSVIKNNKNRYSKQNIQFSHANFLHEDLPSADLFLCKEVLQHLPNEDILAFLPKLKKFKYCLITNEVNPKTLSSDNTNIQIGMTHQIDLTKMTHQIDLTKPPFNMTGEKILTYYIQGEAHQVLLIKNDP